MTYLVKLEHKRRRREIEIWCPGGADNLRLVGTLYPAHPGVGAEFFARGPDGQVLSVARGRDPGRHTGTQTIGHIDGSAIELTPAAGGAAVRSGSRLVLCRSGEGLVRPAVDLWSSPNGRVLGALRGRSVRVLPSVSWEEFALVVAIVSSPCKSSLYSTRDWLLVGTLWPVFHGALGGLVAGPGFW